MLDITEFLNKQKATNRYEKQLGRLSAKYLEIERFQSVIDKAIGNIKSGIKSFVIYGDPQSGKTEMMIGLSARLLDEGNKIVIILLNDNIELLRQNSKRFSESGLDPTPKIFNEVIDPNVNIGDQEWIIFCKKNSKDLQKLIDKIGDKKSKVIIDDEGDYATPNAKINKHEETRINHLVEKLLGDGIYIGVTATPARLDLNNTFNNASIHWIYFKPHGKYTGQDIFFPLNNNLKYKLKFLPDEDDNPQYLKVALLSFFVDAAYLNIKTGSEENYCMLVHTSGKKADHSEDYKEIIEILNILADKDHKDYSPNIKLLCDIAEKNFNKEPQEIIRRIIRYILQNIRRYKVVVMNSDSDRKNFDFTEATDPVALFTIAIGGNIVSRGVTFKNLLSMFFTRDVKHKIQQDTYIQRARMFGSRGDYLQFFELTIPRSLYYDWHRCFIFHRLSLQSAMAGNAPVWIEDSRVKTVATSSIDKTTIRMDSGEMSFEIFKYSTEVENVLNSSMDPFEVLDGLKNFLGDDCLPQYLIGFINEFSHDGINSLAIHSSTDIKNRGPDTDKENIQRRPKNLIGSTEMQKEKYPHAIHHIKIFFNSDNNKARVFYRYVNSVKFLKNLKFQ